jgi:hypothetical protein
MKKFTQLVREKKVSGKTFDEWMAETDFYHLPRRVKSRSKTIKKD